MTLSSVSPALRASLLAVLCLSVSACNSGSRSSNNTGGSAPVTSGTGAVTSLPTPGGTTAALGSAQTVHATLQTGAFDAFQTQRSTSDLQIPDQAGLRSTAFVVEDDGTLRVLDLSGASPALLRAFNVYASPLPGGSSTGSLNVLSPTLALLTSSGGGGERVALFDPLNATSAADVTLFSFDSLTFTWPAGTTNDKGADVGGQPLALTYTSGAMISGQRLFLTSSNFDSNFDLNPGTIVTYDIDVSSRQLSGAGAYLGTSDFNPTGLTRVATPQGDALLVTNTGPFGGGGASIDVIDPIGFAKVGTIELPNDKSPVGRITVSPDGRRGYVASQAAAEVYVLDLEDLGLELGNGATADLDARYLGAYSLPTNATTNFISSLGLSHTGDYLYAVSFNESVLYVIDLTAPGLGAAVSGFQRTADTTNYEGLANSVAVRPGVPGTDFSGPSLYVMTINLNAADQTQTGVRVVLDTVTVDRH